MKIYEAWEELADWLAGMNQNDLLSPRDVLDKIDELEAKHE